MMLVVTMHYFGHGGATHSCTTAVNFVFASGAWVFSRLSIDCFYLITGYFLKPCYKIDISKRQTYRFFKLWIKVFLYSVGIILLYNLIVPGTFNVIILLKYSFPVFNGVYWFMTIFLLLLVFCPFLGRMLDQMSRSDYIYLILVYGFFDCVVCTFGGNTFNDGGFGFLHGLYMLILGYGLKHHQLLTNKKINIICLILGLALSAGIGAFQIMVLKKPDAYACNYNSPFIVLAALAFFRLVTALKIHWRWVSRIAPYTLAIYLINDHPVIQQHFWINVLHCDHYYGSLMIIPHYLFCLIGFTLAGIVIDYFVSRGIEFVSKGRITY